MIRKILFLFWIVNASCQENVKSNFTFSGYLDVYYCYDFNNPKSHERPNFVYSHNRHNELNLNLGFAKVNYAEPELRATAALMAGTYANANMIGEPATLRNVFEANVGLKISKHHNLWIDAGMMPSHIGFESAVSADCQTVTRSLLADNSPYFETGVKIGYTSPSEKWYLSVMYLNGWQRIQKIEGNQTPAFGTQILYKPTSKIVANWSTYFGNEQPDRIEKWRYFSNLYLIYSISNQTNLTAGFDFGIQQQNSRSKDYANWYSPVLIFQQRLNKKTHISIRGEYFHDGNNTIISTTRSNGFSVYGLSSNIDFKLQKNTLFRIEARKLDSNTAVFISDEVSRNNNIFLTTSLSVSF